MYLSRYFLFVGLTILSTLPLIAYASDPPFTLPPQAELGRIRSAIISTNRGQLYFELFPEDAPWHVANFKYLADKGYYRRLRFHLYRPGFIIQGGAPPGKPDGGPGYSLPAEFSSRKHQLGTLGMARKPDLINPQRRSNGGQFHMLLSEAPHMDGSYTIFGRITKGFEILSSLEKGDMIEDIRVFVAPSHNPGDSR